MPLASSARQVSTSPTSNVQSPRLRRPVRGKSPTCRKSTQEGGLRPSNLLGEWSASRRLAAHQTAEPKPLDLGRWTLDSLRLAAHQTAQPKPLVLGRWTLDSL